MIKKRGGLGSPEIRIEGRKEKRGKVNKKHKLSNISRFYIFLSLVLFSWFLWLGFYFRFFCFKPLNIFGPQIFYVALDQGRATALKIPKSTDFRFLLKKAS